MAAPSGVEQQLEPCGVALALYVELVGAACDLLVERAVLRRVDGLVDDVDAREALGVLLGQANLPSGC